MQVYNKQTESTHISVVDGIRGFHCKEVCSARTSVVVMR